MSTITLYKDKVNGVGSLIDDIIKSSNNLNTQLGTLRNTVQGVNSSTCDLQSTVDSISSSSKSEKEKVEDLKKLNKKLTEFIELTDKRDESARDAINKSKKDFYSKYKHLKPECEKSFLEHVSDTMKAVGEWCKEHWKLIATIVIVAVSIAVLLIPGVGPIIAGACWGAIMGAVIGGVSGGLDSMANGGSFLDGFEDGALSGAIGGAIGGAAFAGLGQLGVAAGNALNNFYKGAACVSKIGKVVKGTAAVTKVMSTAMGGFDTIALLDKAFGNGDIASLNAKLHENKAYNIFQTGVTATAVFTGSMSNSMTCFIAGTLVATINGLIAIESIKAGDYVLSANPDTMEIAYKLILETYVREVDKLIHLVVNGEEIISTFDHPFYVKDKGFVSAEMLWIGAELINNNGDILFVEKIYREVLDNQTRTVYNFKVDEYHTYFVGSKFVLVHNAEYTNTALKQTEFNSEYEDRLKQTPGTQNKVVEFEGTRGESKCKLKPPPDSELQKIFDEAGIDGIEYKRAVPDFSPTSKLELSGIDMSKGRTGKNGTYAQANNKFVKMLNESPELAQEFGITPKKGTVFKTSDIKRYMSTNKLTWHELNDLTTVQMVPTKVNSTFGHLGGISEAAIK